MQSLTKQILALLVILALVASLTYVLVHFEGRLWFEDGDPQYSPMMGDQIINDEPNFSVALNYTANHDAWIALHVNHNSTTLFYWNGTEYVPYTDPIPVPKGSGQIRLLVNVHGDEEVFITAHMTKR